MPVRAALWWIAQHGADTGLKFFYYLVMLFIYQSGYAVCGPHQPTCAECVQGFQVPGAALTMHLSPEPRQRDSATTYRLAIEIIAVLVSTIVEGVLCASCAPRGMPQGCW